MQAAITKLESNTKLRNVCGALYFLALASLALWQWKTTGRIFDVLLAFRFLILVGFTLKRLPPAQQAPVWQSVLAYGTLFIPLAYSFPATPSTPLAILISNLLFVTGFLLAALAAIELGPRFGVTPAKRGEVCRTGVYRWLNHPMYVGYGIAEFGWNVLNWANIPIYLASMAAQYLRAKTEERLLSV